MRATARGWAVASFLGVFALVGLATEPAAGSRTTESSGAEEAASTRSGAEARGREGPSGTPGRKRLHPLGEVADPPAGREPGCEELRFGGGTPGTTAGRPPTCHGGPVGHSPTRLARPPPPGPGPELAPARARWVLDRIEEEVAVIVGPGGARVVPVETLGAGAREGDLLDERWRPDRVATARARARLGALRARSAIPGGGDLRLDEPSRQPGAGADDRAVGSDEEAAGPRADR